MSMKVMLKSAVFAAVALFGAATTASAGTISVFHASLDRIYQNTANSPCIFYGPGNCPQDPAGWPTPTGDTGGGGAFNPNPLLQDYLGADFTAWTSVVGTSFIIGLDINDTDDAQTLSNFTITFRSAGGTLLDEWHLGSILVVPDVFNGVGWADYILAAGCAGTITGSGANAECSDYTPFVAPAGTAQIFFSFGLNPFNDGPDKIFVIPQTPNEECPPTVCSPVPEPASMMLLGTGLAGLAFAVRRRRRNS